MYTYVVQAGRYLNCILSAITDEAVALQLVLGPSIAHDAGEDGRVIKRGSKFHICLG